MDPLLTALDITSKFDIPCSLFCGFKTLFFNYSDLRFHE